MSHKRFPWYRSLHAHINATIQAPIYRLVRRYPRVESGLDQHECRWLILNDTALAGRRAVHITDLHLDAYLPRHDAVVQSIASSRPDWIFVTGDLLNVPEGLPHLFRFLSALRSVAPVYVTLGNHDHYSGVPVDAFVEQAERHKVQLLINQVVCVPLRSSELCIIGLDDPATHRADVRCIPRASTASRFTILLAHAPRIVEELEEEHAADLILCGHSHGGQVRIGGIPPVWLPYGCGRHHDGLYTDGRRRLYVNRGLGWSALPIRRRCPPEILVIEWQVPTNTSRLSHHSL